MNGFFITFEGPEGTGKTTQVNLLARALRAQGKKVLVTKEPGGTLLGQHLRRVLLSYRTKNLSPLTELFLMLADRAQHVREVIRPALKKGLVVISDRYGDSTLAYQGYGRGMDVKWLERLNRQATGGLQPDLTLLLDMDPKQGLRRAKGAKKSLSQKGKGDRFEQEALKFHQKVRAGYLALAKKYSRRFRVVAVERKSVGDVAGKVMQAAGKVV